MFCRKNNRLEIKELYQKNNWYFITICTQNRECIFSTISSNGVACTSSPTTKQVITETISPSNTVQTSSGVACNSLLDTEQSLILNSNQPNTTRTIQKPDYELQATPQLTQIGKVIESNWFYLETLFSDISLKDFLILPIHVHFILELGNNPSWRNSQKPTDLGNIVKALKSKSIVDSKKLGIFHNQTFWQRSYYDHIIREESELLRIREYIQNNPAQWELDILNPINEKKYKEKFVNL